MMMRILNFRTAMLLLAAITMVGLAACGGEKTEGKKKTGSDAKRGTPENPWVIGMSQCSLQEPWRVQMDKDVETFAAAHPELKMIFKNADGDSLRQRSHVEEFVDQKIDLLIISPKETVPLTEPVAQAFKAGIPVIVLDRAVDGDDYTQFIGADNVKIGREAGKWTVAALGGTGKVVELKGLMTSQPGQDRHNGFLEGIKGSNIEVIFEVDCEWLEPNGRKEMDSALSRFEQIDLVYAHNDPVAHGAYLSAQSAGRAEKIKFVGIDALPHEGVAYVKDGILSATFEYPTGGKEAIESALTILNGGQVEKKIVLGTKLFTKENAETGGQALE